ncbi:MAG: hypothetical protein KHY19_18505 [Coprobacillus cateniformis]|nr:hypothetical protein [Coprobacillus cateniformis]
MNFLGKKAMGITLASVMILGVGTTAFADTTHIDFDRVNLDAVEIDYASIVERLELEELTDYIRSEELKNPSISQSDLEGKLKAKVIQEGVDERIISVDDSGNVIFTTNKSGGISTRSYGDLPIVKNKLGKNEKKVFNKSLVKGVKVLEAGQSAMKNYKRYYDSDYGWEDDNGDAFRHASWMALAAHYAGASYTREFGIAHEDDYPSTDLAREMDLNNNDVGIEKAEKIPSNTPTSDVDLVTFLVINDAVKNGELKRFKGPDIGTLDHLVETNSQGAKK